MRIRGDLALARCEHHVTIGVKIAGDIAEGERHALGERNARVLPVVTMADYAIMRECLLAVGKRPRVVWQGIFLLFAPDERVVLCERGHARFQLAWWCGAAASQTCGKQKR